MSSSSTYDDYSSRTDGLQAWFRQIFSSLPIQHSLEAFDIKLIRGDASFRRYFRASAGSESFILVDAPPQKEDSRPFVQITGLYQEAGVRVPEIHEVDMDQGYLCLSDFGDLLLWEKLDSIRQKENGIVDVGALYQQAVEQLHKIQSIRTRGNLPDYSAQRLNDEMHLFRHWFCEKLLGLKFNPVSEKILSQCFNTLRESALAQTQVSVHRDFHSRNLMLLDDDSLGVIDYQDAVMGPLSYDLVSLLKDCYIAWPREEVMRWAESYFQQIKPDLAADLSTSEFISDFDLMGVQRHLKAIGIFSRLFLRDQKVSYLVDIPRTLSYLSELKDHYPQLDDFLHWLDDEVVQDIEEKILAATLRESSH
jgi:aminoglycoside/choline kinase family phosphotransferase